MLDGPVAWAIAGLFVIALVICPAVGGWYMTKILIDRRTVRTPARGQAMNDADPD